jgi:hypothetical protein
MELLNVAGAAFAEPFDAIEDRRGIAFRKPSEITLRGLGKFGIHRSGLSAEARPKFGRVII